MTKDEMVDELVDEAVMNAMDRITEIVLKEREAAFRRGLILAGYMPRSVDVMVDRDREWLEAGLR